MAELRDALKKLTDASPDELEDLLRLSQGTQRQQLLKAVVEAEASLVPQAGQLQEPAAPLPISMQLRVCLWARRRRTNLNPNLGASAMATVTTTATSSQANRLHRRVPVNLFNSTYDKFGSGGGSRAPARVCRPPQWYSSSISCLCPNPAKPISKPREEDHAILAHGIGATKMREAGALKDATP